MSKYCCVWMFSLILISLPNIVLADVIGFLEDVGKVVTAPVKVVIEVTEGVAEAAGKLVTEGPKSAGEKIKNGVDEAGAVIEKDVTKQIKDTSNRIYDQTIVDSGVEHAVSSFNEQVLEPLWPEIGQAMKSICHNYCEGVYGQSDGDERFYNSGEKGDGVNQGYEQCMLDGCFVSVTVNGDGEVTGGCLSDGNNRGCYENTEETVVKEKKVKKPDVHSANYDSTLVYLREVFGVSEINPSQDFEINLPPLIDEVFQKNAQNLATGNHLNQDVYTSEMFLEKISTHNNPSTDINHAVFQYLLTSEYVMDQESILNKLHDSKIGWASVGLYVAGYTKLLADGTSVILDSYSGGLGGSAVKLGIKKGLAITGDVIDIVLAKDHKEARSMVVVVKHFTEFDVVGEVADKVIDATDNIQLVYVEIPNDAESASMAKKGNIKRVEKNILRGKVETKRWRRVVEDLAKAKGLPNPVPSFLDDLNQFKIKLECVPVNNTRCVELKVGK